MNLFTEAIKKENEFKNKIEGKFPQKIFYFNTYYIIKVYRYLNGFYIIEYVKENSNIEDVFYTLFRIKSISDIECINLVQNKLKEIGVENESSNCNR